jgi:hypothetical protein
MDAAGFNLFMVEVIGALLLLAALIYVVARGAKRRSGEASIESSEQATSDLYEDENRREKDGTDGKSD